MQATKPQQNLTLLYTREEYLAKLVPCNAVDPDGLLSKAISYAWSAQQHQPDNVMPSSLDVALQLNQLGVDETTLIVALLSDNRLRAEGFVKQVESEFGRQIAQMVEKLHWLNDFQPVTHDGPGTHAQIEPLRRMLLAMVEDIRVMLIKLAYRVHRLRQLAQAPSEVRQRIARETMDIFAPLANRLGVAQLKWELEDLSFRYLDSATYKQIAKLLEEKREEREQYINDAVAQISRALEDAGLEADVYGRPKHIYSIWRKMSSKKKDFHELFDVRAVRVTVSNVAQCYTALGVIHGLWKHISQEFDDYIANPKTNGYQSLHTAVIGPGGKPLEIQIRTYEMHQFAEYGVAAHWRYKEGGTQDRRLEGNIASLRRLLDPGETQDEDLLDSFHTDMFPGRVFVLTPNGQVMDPPQGATPLDFAYAVHTEIGHRCRGAKVNGHIVPLTYHLRNGEQVEILTTKQSRPSRDWLNKHLGYLATSRARSKVRSWFRQQDYDQNVLDGKTIIDRELLRQALKEIDLPLLAAHFGQSSIEGLYAAVGRGDTTTGQLAAALQELFVEIEGEKLPLISKPASAKKQSRVDELKVLGVGNLLTTIANCCKPVPGDEIIGYITRGQGVAVHNVDCVNVLNLDETKRGRLVEVEWGNESSRLYPVSLYVEAIDRQGLLRDVTKVLADSRVNVTGVNTLSDQKEQIARMTLVIEVNGLEQLGRVMDSIAQLPNVTQVGRAKVGM